MPLQALAGTVQAPFHFARFDAETLSMGKRAPCKYVPYFWLALDADHVNHPRSTWALFCLSNFCGGAELLLDDVYLEIWDLKQYDSLIGRCLVPNAEPAEA